MTDIITSTQNPRIKAVVDLHHARARRESGQMLIDGAREIGRAIDAGIQIDEAYFCPDRLDGGQVKNLVGRLQETGCAMIAVSDRVYDKIGYGERSDGIVAVARRPVRRLE
ncbi:MAG TPA: RNA methyltransferase substrate-binding domain-containing protein, partial [Phycisphaerae bacterium]|nr:RNA methyltransferase substrate-binding domain-containing protein [Phycisphaerae bacterium]